MRIWFIRHARAIDREETSLPDFQRPLIPKGRKEFAKLCRHLAERVKLPEVILTSPLIRAVQTAEIACREFDLSAANCRIEERLSPELTIEKLRAVIEEFSRQSPGVERIGLVGHEPSLGEALWASLGGSEAAQGTPLVKGGIAEVEVSEGKGVGEGRLRWVMTPKLVG